MTPHLYYNTPALYHDTGSGHPERRERLQTLLDLFNEAPFRDWPQFEAPDASREQIARVHPPDYIDRIEGSVPAHGLNFLDGDTAVSPGSWKAALSAAGGVCQAVDDVMGNKASRAFCAVRPPGHHAEYETTMGFCLFDNIVIGARQAQEIHGIKNVAIIDFDVHHGNGTDNLVRRYDNIMLVSSHQSPLFPGTGRESENKAGVSLNLPLSAGDGSEEFRRVWRETGLPAIEEFAPELIMISAGFDGHGDDPLAGLNLTEDDFAWITEEISRLANDLTQGRIVSVLEGGYDLEALANSVAAHLQALAR